MTVIKSMSRACVSENLAFLIANYTIVLHYSVQNMTEHQWYNFNRAIEWWKCMVEEDQRNQFHRKRNQLTMTQNNLYEIYSLTKYSHSTASFACISRSKTHLELKDWFQPKKIEIPVYHMHMTFSCAILGVLTFDCIFFGTMSSLAWPTKCQIFQQFITRVKYKQRFMIRCSNTNVIATPSK